MRCCFKICELEEGVGVCVDDDDDHGQPRMMRPRFRVIWLIAFDSLCYCVCISLVKVNLFCQL